MNAKNLFMCTICTIPFETRWLLLYITKSNCYKWLHLSANIGGKTEYLICDSDNTLFFFLERLLSRWSAFLASLFLLFLRLQTETLTEQNVIVNQLVRGFSDNPVHHLHLDYFAIFHKYICRWRSQYWSDHKLNRQKYR